MFKRKASVKTMILTLLMVAVVVISVVYLIKDSRTLDINAADLPVDERLAKTITLRYLAGEWTHPADLHVTPYAVNFVKETTSTFKVYTVDERDKSFCKGSRVVVEKKSGEIFQKDNVNYCEEYGFQYHFQIESLENMDNFTVQGDIINDPIERNDSWKWSIDFEYTGPTPVRMVSYDVAEVSKEKVFNQAFKQGESFHVEGKLPDMKKTLKVTLHWKENGEKQQGKVIYNIAKTDLKEKK